MVGLYFFDRQTPKQLKEKKTYFVQLFIWRVVLVVIELTVYSDSYVPGKKPKYTVVCKEI